MNASPTICSFHSTDLLLNRGGACVVLALLVMLAGCAGSGSSGRSSEFDPFGFPGEDTVVTAGVVGERPEPRSTPTETTPRVIPQVDTETETIIRVQFYTTTNHREAEDVLGRASGALDVPVAMEFDTPYYKLMAGPLPTREAADKLALRLRAMGYEAAWVVREQVSATPK
ncbi:MAG: hypothetical protein GF341_06135 [candidate division Zixibacteria bacterium]|nr:hypothetical protein [candidate division Zixibacteria bacterium]